MAEPHNDRASEREPLQGSGLPQSFWIIGACTALSVAFADSLLAMLTEPGGLQDLLAFFPALSLLALALLGVFVVLSRATHWLRPAGARERPVVRAFALGVFLIAAFTLAWLAGLNSGSALRARPVASIVSLGLLTALSAVVAAAAHRLALRTPAGPAGETSLLRGVTLATLALASITGAIAVWQTSEPGGLARLGGVAATFAIAGLLMLETVRARPERLRRIPLTLLAGVIASPCVTLVGWGMAATPPPSALPSDAPIRHIVLLTVDTLRRDSLTVYNPEHGAATPQLDHLARESLIFDNAFSSAPWTVPAFVSLFTGLAPDVHGINHNFPRLPDELPTLAEQLREAGYATAAIGIQVQLQRMGRGFDHFQLGPERSPFHRLTTFGRPLGRPWTPENWTGQRVSKLAVDWLDANRDQDFFLWIHWIEPHVAYAPPLEYLPDSIRHSDLGTAFDGDLQALVRAGQLIRTQRERDWLRDLYAAEVRYTDHLVGQVVEHLRALGLYDAALIVFTSDHGEEFWEHGGWEHGHSVYNELVAAPLFIKLPGARQTERIQTAVSTAALFDTLLDLAEAPRESGPLVARSLRPLWQESEAGGPPPSPDPVYMAGVEYFEPQEAVVFDHYKFIARRETGLEELYDLERDPGEAHSLAKTHSALLERGRELLQKRRAEVSRLAPDTSRESRLPEPLSPDVEDQLRALGYVD